MLGNSKVAEARQKAAVIEEHLAELLNMLSQKAVNTGKEVQTAAKKLEKSGETLSGSG